MASPTAWQLSILVVVVVHLTDGSSQNALGCRQNVQSVEVVELDGPGYFHVISSPNYPEGYDATKGTYNCEWRIRPQFGSKIKMHTVHANMQSACLQNKLQVYVKTLTEKSKFKDKGLLDTCGNNNFPGPLEDIETENEVIVKFNSYDNVWSDKFKLIFYSTPLPEASCPADTYKYEGCPSWPNTCCKGENCCVITAGNQPVELRSPAYPQDSGAERDCSFRVEAPSGARINLNFLDMDILTTGSCEQSEDYVKVVDNSTASIFGKNGKKFCGNRLPNYPGPSVFVSGGNSLTVTYKTSSTIAPRGKGFKALVSAINPWCNNKITYHHKYGDKPCDETCVPKKHPRPCPCRDVEIAELLITVKNKKNGNPVSCAIIKVDSMKNKQVISNQNGEAIVEMRIPANGTYVVNVTTDDFIFQTESVDISCPRCCKCCKCTTKIQVDLEPKNKYACIPTPIADWIRNMNKKAGNLVKNVKNKVNGLEDADRTNADTTDADRTDADRTDDDSKCKSSKNDTITRGYLTFNAMDQKGLLIPEVLIIINATQNSTTRTYNASLTTNKNGSAATEIDFNGDYKFTLSKTKDQCIKTRGTKIRVIKTRVIEENIDCAKILCPNCIKELNITVERINCTGPRNNNKLKVIVRGIMEKGRRSIFLQNASVIVTYIPEGRIVFNGRTPSRARTRSIVYADIVGNGVYQVYVEREQFVSKTQTKDIQCFDPDCCDKCTPHTTVILDRECRPGVECIVDPVLCEPDDPSLKESSAFILEIKVFDNKTGAILNNARIDASYQNNAIVHNGIPTQYKILSNGLYKFTVIQQGYYEKTELKTINCTSIAKCRCGSNPLNITLEQDDCQSMSLLVTVLDEDTGKVIADANVTVYLQRVDRNKKSIHSELTNKKGTTQTDIKLAGDYLIVVEKKGFENNSLTKEIPLNEDGCFQRTGPPINKVNITLKRIPDCEKKKVDLTIEVINEKSKNKVGGANVDVKLESSGLPMDGVNPTNNLGITSIRITQLGKYTVSAKKGKYVTKTTEVIIDKCNNTNTTVEIPQGNTTCNTEMSITIRNCLTKERIKNAKIMVQHKEIIQNEIIKTRITDKSLPSNENGVLNVPINQNGEYIITVTKTEPKKYNEKIQSLVVTCNPQKCDECNPEKTVDICPEHCTNKILTVTVTEKDKNGPIGGASVTLYLSKPLIHMGYPRTIKTNENGVAKVNITTFINGNYTVMLQATGYETKYESKKLTCENMAECEEMCKLSVNGKMKEKGCQNKIMNVTVHSSRDNSALKGAVVTVRIAGCNEPAQIYKNTVDSNSGTASIKVEANGFYMITVSKPGFITQTKTVHVRLTIDKCNTSLNELIPLSPESPNQNCTDVTVSLKWKENPKDLDLFSWDGCLTYYCEPIGDKPQCPCTNFTNDNREGGLRGSETIEYKCCDEEKTHMIYVDDRSGKGVYLMESEAEIIINGKESKSVKLKKIETLEKPRYWLVGCLTMESDGHYFEYLNEFSRTPPHITNNQLCKRRANIRKAAKTIDQLTVLTIKAIDTENNHISGAHIEVSNQLVSYAGTTSSNGNVDIKVYANGKYQVDVHLNGYTSTSSQIETHCQPNEECTKRVYVQIANMTSITDGAKVTLLYDNDVGNKLSLSDFKVNIADHSQTCRSSEKACNGVKINENFPQMASFNKDNNRGYTNMIIVSCKEENNCHDLERVKPRLVVVEGEKSQTLNMPDMGSNAQSNSKYWIAGCLKIVKQSFIFVPTDRFVHKDPSELNHNERLYCHSLFKKRTSQTEDVDWCTNVNIDIKIVHSSTGQIIQDAKATVYHIHDTVETLVAAEQRLENGTGNKVSVKIDDDGKYLIYIKATNFHPISDQIIVECDLTKCSSCKPTILISMVPKIPTDLKITMNWDERPANLDVIIFQAKKQYDKTSTCLTENKSSVCPTVKITANNDGGGYHGGEEVTFDDTFKLDRFVYMVYVKDGSDEPIAFNKSNVRLSFTDSTSTSKIVKATDENFDNDKFWFAGCLRAKAGSFHFKPVNMLMKTPPNELVPETCNQMFSLKIDPSNCFLHNTSYNCDNMNDGVQTEEVSAENCHKKCANTDSCVGFVWNEKTEYCWLKTSMTTKKVQTGMTSGPSKCTKPKAIDGGWSEWSGCTTLCGGGTRNRTCNNPLVDGGKDCQGPAKENCNIHTCPIDGGWSEWTECTTLCGGGTRNRTCNNPLVDGGKDCQGLAKENCNIHTCPVNGGWSDWGPCSATCGTATRRKTCTKPEPGHGGADCAGTDTEDCKNKPCRVILTISTANAINNRQVGGVKVSLFAQNRVFSQATSNDRGYATLASPQGKVEITGEKDGFQIAPIDITVDDEVSKSDVKVSASPKTSEPARVVMNWGRRPSDLDLHVKQVSGGWSLCHCFYSNKLCGGIALDVDNVLGGHKGAETMMWSRVEAGSQYVVYVHDYSGTSTHLTDSAARIAIYTSGKQPTQVNVPTGRGASRYWLVGCFNSDGRNGFSIINQLRATEPNYC